MRESTATETSLALRVTRHLVGSLFLIGLLNPATHDGPVKDAPMFIAVVFALVWGAAAVVSGLWWLFFTKHAKGRFITVSIWIAWILTFLMLLGFWQQTMYAPTVNVIALALLATGGLGLLAFKLLPKGDD